jgi:hypothetical protein
MKAEYSPWKPLTAPAMIVVHPNHSLIADGIEDPETLAFCRDLHSVSTAVHQGMAIGGPWMEARVKMIVRSWLPAGWLVSGPAQIFCADSPGIRSRSWDIVVHRQPDAATQLPAPSSPESGYPLLPNTLVAAIIDTKTNFADPREYAAQPVFNLMNDAVQDQLSFIGGNVAKFILAASSPRSPDSMTDVARPFDLFAFSLGRYKAGPVADGIARITSWRLERHADGSYPLQRFKDALLAAVAVHSATQDGRCSGSNVTIMAGFGNCSTGTP